MRIAQVAPLHESVPPHRYGGTERVVSYLTEELVRQGHEVTLYASGDSSTRARLVPGCRRSLRLDTACLDPLSHHVLMLERVFQRATSFDIVHFHVEYLHFPFARARPIPHVGTLHGRLDLPELHPLFNEYRDMPLVSISRSQRTPLPALNWQAIVPHGLPPERYRFHPDRGDYLAFLGRISPEKRVDRAIDIAARAGLPLRIAAKVDRADREYFENVIEPLLDAPGVEYIGEIGDEEKSDFLGNARALLFPIDWPEPFGLVMIEAMACGTPVIAYRNGSVPEVIEHGATGFVVERREDAIAAVQGVGSLSRARCRETFERRFTVQRMARDYLHLYERLAEPMPHASTA